MKKWLSIRMILFLAVLISISTSASSALAWGQSTHAYAAKKSLGVEQRYIANYNARMGSIVPDFFWYLRDLGLIDQDTAFKLHGITEYPEVVPETTYFYDIASSNLKPWNYKLKYFTEGIRTHVYADIQAHNSVDGYVEGSGMWCDLLQEKTGEDREALHMAIELAVDSLLVHKYGLQLGDILFCPEQANFMAEAVEDAFNQMNVTPNFDVSREFKKYLALMRILEKAARLYAPYLMKGEVNEELLNTLVGSELLDAESELSDDSLDIYLTIRTILLNYPKEIYETITTEGMHWENDALPQIIEFCGVQ